MNGIAHRIGTWVILLGMIFALMGCGQKGCEGPKLNKETLLSLKRRAPSGANDPRAFLVFPNPIEATGSTRVMASTPNLLASAARAFFLPDLLSPSRLENDFLKIRIRDTNDDPSTLARPNSQGQYAFEVSDVHYSETMAYYAISAEMAYVEALGFKVVKSRPLYVMVRAKSLDGQANAVYEHNPLNRNLPRKIRLFGEGQYAPGVDGDMYLHEFGHLFNESVSREVGIDFAGDNQAAYTEGAALHESLADYLALSYSDRDSIGRWLARNFQEIPPGEPLRSAVDRGGRRLRFRDVAFNDGTGAYPERYAVGEWLLRVMWEIRDVFVSKDPETGPLFADRLIFSALAFLGRDTSITEFREALLTADDKLYCGGHQDQIVQAFDSRGFLRAVPRLEDPLGFSAEPIAVDGAGKPTTIRPGATIAFRVRVRNPNKEAARNVRIRLDSRDRRLVPTTYQQGLGDIPPGRSVEIGSDGGLPIFHSVFAETDRNSSRGTKLRYSLRLLVENGEESVLTGEIGL